jgi:hypothetical protein
MTRPPLGTLFVVAVLAAGTVVGSLVDTSASAARSQAEPVEVVGSSAVCPDLRQVQDRIATRVSVGAAPLPAGRTGKGGSITSARVTRPDAPLAVPVTQAGQVAVGLSTTTDKDGLVVTAGGVLAAGLEVEQVTRGEDGRDRGLAGLRCEAPKPEAWFAGGSTGIAHTTVLVLANVDDTPSTVDVTVFTQKGAVDNRPGQGITIRPHTRQVINLDTLAPDREWLAVHVLARRGRVAAGLRHATGLASNPQGVDWVPQTVPPATRVVVPGIPAGDGTRALRITNPGSDDTTVSVQVTTDDGQFVPTGLDAVEVPAQTTVEVRVEDQAKTSPLSATVTSAGAPIIAGGYVKDLQRGTIREFAYTAGALPLSGPALVTDVVIDRPTESTLILSAPQGGATVVVTPIRVLGQSGPLPAPKTVRIGSGRTATLRLSTFFEPAAQAQLAVELRPQDGSGPVYAARYLRERGAHGPLTTLLVLQGPAQLVSRPDVVQDGDVSR